MSFIYAEKYCDPVSNSESVRILCDTKVSLNEYSSITISKEGYDLISKYGLVKSTIVCPELCISFAGNNIAYAAKLLNKLFDLRSFEVEDVSKYALEIHRETANQNEIEFIITYISSGKIHIDCIKNGIVSRDLQLAHIGSEDAFKDFQRMRIGASVKTEQAFLDTVNGCSDDSVGGRVIEVKYNHNDNSFVYNWKRGFCSSKLHTVVQGETIKFYNSVEDGGYSYEVDQIDIGNVLYDIDQMMPAILYSRKYRINLEDINNPNLTGLMLPMLVVINDNGEILLYRQ